jgi:hypothetical protein
VPWHLEGSYPETCSSELMFGIEYEGKTGLSTSTFSPAA